MSGSDSVKASRLVVAAAVLDDLGHPTTLLCAARSYPPEHAGQFELPGGKVEPAGGIGLSARLGPELIAPRHLAVPAPSDSGPGDDAPAWPAMHGFRMRVWLAEPARPGDRGRAGADHQRLEWGPLDPPDRLRRLPWLEADLPIIDALVTALAR